MNLLDNAAQTLDDMIELATSWATSGPEGFTKEEKQRVREAEKINRKLVAAAKALRGFDAGSRGIYMTRRNIISEVPRNGSNPR